MSLLTSLLADSKTVLNYQGSCRTCPRALVDFVPATLIPDTDIIAVGEAPGGVEVAEGAGFVGPAGQILRTAAKEEGLPEFSCTNTVHCRPPANRDPTDKAISCCMNQHVMAEVKGYRWVLLVGSKAMRAFFQKEAPRVRGNVCIHPDYPGQRFYGITHPAAQLHEAKKKWPFTREIRRFGRIYRDGIHLPFELIDGDASADLIPKILESSRIASFDLETDNLKTWDPNNKINALSIMSVPGDAVAMLDRGHPFFDEALERIWNYCSGYVHQILGQNIGFDLTVMELLFKGRVQLKHIHDIQNLFYLSRRMKQTGLKRLVSEELDGYRYMVAWPHKCKDPDLLRPYNGEDVFYPQQLFLKEFPELPASTRNLSLTVGGPSSLATARIKKAGIYVLTDTWSSMNEKYVQMRTDALKKWAEEDPQFHPTQIATPNGFSGLEKYMYETKGYPIVKRTNNKKPSSDVEAVKELVRRGYTELNNLLDIRGYDKRISTELKPLPEQIDPVDRRIHANYNNTSTSTGRLSSSDPNMQNRTRGELRGLFGAAPGSIWGGGDFSQIELRLAMALAHDKAGLAAYRNKEDLHKRTAQMITGRDEITYEERTKAKSANFCLIYGGSPEALQAYARDEYGVELTDRESKRWHGGFFELYNDLPTWHKESREIFHQNKGHMTSVVGHTWYYPEWNSDDQKIKSHWERSAINMLCQGPASYMMVLLIYLSQQGFADHGLYRGGRLDAGGELAEVVLTVHDSLAWEVDESLLEQSVGIVHYGLQQVGLWIKDWFTVPLVLDWESGPHWSAMEERGQLVWDQSIGVSHA